MESLTRRRRLDLALSGDAHQRGGGLLRRLQGSNCLGCAQQLGAFPAWGVRCRCTYHSLLTKVTTLTKSWCSAS